MKATFRDQILKTGASKEHTCEITSEGHQTMSHDHATMQEADQ